MLLLGALLEGGPRRLRQRVARHRPADRHHHVDRAVGLDLAAAVDGSVLFVPLNRYTQGAIKPWMDGWC